MQAEVTVHRLRPQAVVPTAIVGLAREETRHELLLEYAIHSLSRGLLESGERDIDGMRLVLRAALPVVWPREAHVVYGAMDDVAKYVRDAVNARVRAPEKDALCFYGEALGEFRLERRRPLGKAPRDYVEMAIERSLEDCRTALGAAAESGDLGRLFSEDPPVRINLSRDRRLRQPIGIAVGLFRHQQPAAHRTLHEPVARTETPLVLFLTRQGKPGEQTLCTGIKPIEDEARSCRRCPFGPLAAWM